MKRVETLVIGAGPTGLGAACGLHDSGQDNWMLVEKENRLGGLASSFKDSKGFTWDFAVHVVHSHYSTFDHVLKIYDPCALTFHQRHAYVYLNKRFIPYPVQRHLEKLPEGLRQKCSREIQELKQTPTVENFNAMLFSTFGASLSNLFMIPYNQKVWRTPLDRMSNDWVRERVSPPLAEKKCERPSENSWGANAEYLYPAEGGIGLLWQGLAGKLPREHIRYGDPVIKVEADKRRVHFQSGLCVEYMKLISTLPLPEFCKLTGVSEWMKISNGLRKTSVQVVCLGFKGSMPDSFSGKTWIYMPENMFPFYRLTPFSNLSEKLVPSGGTYCSFLCECAYGSGEAVPDERLAVDACLQSLVRSELFPDAAERLMSSQVLFSEYGYPVPTLDRNNILDNLLPRLEAMNIYSRGRFGGWKYEESNMDHCFVKGYSLVTEGVRQEAEDSGLETGDRGLMTGDWRPGAEDRSPETGD